MIKRCANEWFMSSYKVGLMLRCYVKWVAKWVNEHNLNGYMKKDSEKYMFVTIMCKIFKP